MCGMRTVPGAVLAAMPLVLLGQGPANAADVTGVAGSAYGYFSSVSPAGGPPDVDGPTPTVTLPASGSSGPITATAPSGIATVGTAIIFSSGVLSVSTQGSIGPSGSVTSSASIQSVGSSGSEALTASAVASTCSATATGTSASTAITNGLLQTDSGDDDPTNSVPDHAPVTVAVPVNPAPNTMFETHLHPADSGTDFSRYVFNEQIFNPDGSVTVNAVHQYLLGPTAVGEVIIGHSVCGVTLGPGTDTTAPRVTKVVPTADATGTAPGANVKAIFSELVNASTVTAGTFKLFKKGSTTKVAAAVTYDPSLRKATLNPTNPLPRGITYKAVVTTSVKDTAGNRLDQDVASEGSQSMVWFFTVSG